MPLRTCCCQCLRSALTTGTAAAQRAGEHLAASARVPRGALQVLPLHSSLSLAEQARVFLRPPPGVRKVCVVGDMAGVVGVMGWVGRLPRLAWSFNELVAEHRRK